MHLKHSSIGIILIIIGIAILSPLDDLLILIPIAVVYDPSIIPVMMAIGAICLAIGIFLVGKSTLMHYGMIGKAIAHHPVVILGFVLIISALVYGWLNGMF